MITYQTSPPKQVGIQRFLVVGGGVVVVRKRYVEALSILLGKVALSHHVNTSISKSLTPKSPENRIFRLKSLSVSCLMLFLNILSVTGVPLRAL